MNESVWVSAGEGIKCVIPGQCSWKWYNRQVCWMVLKFWLTKILQSLRNTDKISKFGLLSPLCSLTIFNVRSNMRPHTKQKLNRAPGRLNRAPGFITPLRALSGRRNRPEILILPETLSGTDSTSTVEKLPKKNKIPFPAYWTKVCYNY